MAGKKGAPFGNKNAIGQHSGFGIGVIHGAALTPVGSTIAGVFGGAMGTRAFQHKQKQGATLGGAGLGAIAGGLTGGPGGALVGGLVGGGLTRIGTGVGQWAGRKVNPRVETIGQPTRRNRNGR